MEQPMTILEKLCSGNKTRVGEHSSPEARLRRKMLAALEQYRDS